MPEFHLNQNHGASHPVATFDEFTLGYVAALFFTNGDTGDSDEWSLNRLGTARLTKDSCANIAATCRAFQGVAESFIAQALKLEAGGEGLRYAREPLSAERLGQLFWYARQGHGVTFCDDGDSPCLHRLQEIAQGFGEVYPCTARGWIHV